MFPLRTDVPGANPAHAAFQVQPPTSTMAMGMTPMVGMPMGMIQPEPVQALLKRSEITSNLRDSCGSEWAQAHSLPDSFDCMWLLIDG